MRIQVKQAVSHSTRPNRFLRLSRDFFLIVGVLALGYSGFVLLDTKLFQSYQARLFQRQLEGARLVNTSAGGTRDSPVSPIPEGALGKIEIDRIGLSAMIMEGVSNGDLRRAVGHIPGTALLGQQGNVGIAGHRDTFFRPLRNVRQDDEITVTTLAGTYHYLVDSTQVVAPEDTRVLDSSDDTILTLVTCYPFYFVGPSPKRFVVRAHQIPG